MSDVLECQSTPGIIFTLFQEETSRVLDQELFRSESKLGLNKLGYPINLTLDEIN